MMVLYRIKKVLDNRIPRRRHPYYLRVNRRRGTFTWNSNTSAPQLLSPRAVALRLREAFTAMEEPCWVFELERVKLA